MDLKLLKKCEHFSPCLLIVVCVFMCILSQFTEASSQNLLMNENDNKCEAIWVPECRDIPYNQTILPNILGHRSQKEAEAYLVKLRTWLASDCHPSLRVFLCFLYIPVCTVLEEPIPPCRAHCETMTHACGKELMDKLGVACEDFPNGGLCVGLYNAQNQTSTLRPRTLQNTAKYTTPGIPEIEKGGKLKNVENSDATTQDTTHSGVDDRDIEDDDNEDDDLEGRGNETNDIERSTVEGSDVGEDLGVLDQDCMRGSSCHGLTNQILNGRQLMCCPKGYSINVMATHSSSDELTCKCRPPFEKEVRKGDSNGVTKLETNLQRGSWWTYFAWLSAFGLHYCLFVAV